jgi:hypothetical protein
VTHRLAWVTRLAGFALLFGLVGCTSIPAANSPVYRVVSAQPGDRVIVGGTTGDVTIDITSERGIGKAEIERLGAPPETLTINFHLKGLEELQFAWASATVVANVASGDGSLSEEVRVGGGQASPIDSASPYWTPVRIEPPNAEIPLDSGYFAVTASPGFLQAAPVGFSLQWIDFYR